VHGAQVVLETRGAHAVEDVKPLGCRQRYILDIPHSRWHPAKAEGCKDGLCQRWVKFCGTHFIR
jgi:hypothetical protein